MIKSFKHKGLKKFFETGSTAGINTMQAPKIATRLEVLNRAVKIEDVDIPGFFFTPTCRKPEWCVVYYCDRELANYL